MKPIQKLVAPTHEIPQVLLVGQKNKRTKKQPGERNAFQLRADPETRTLVNDLLASTGTNYSVFMKEFLREKGWEFAEERNRRTNEEFQKRRPQGKAESGQQKQ